MRYNVIACSPASARAVVEKINAADAGLDARVQVRIHVRVDAPQRAPAGVVSSFVRGLCEGEIESIEPAARWEQPDYLDEYRVGGGRSS